MCRHVVMGVLRRRGKVVERIVVGWWYWLVVREAKGVSGTYIDGRAVRLSRIGRLHSEVVFSVGRKGAVSGRRRTGGSSRTPSASSVDCR